MKTVRKPLTPLVVMRRVHLLIKRIEALQAEIKSVQARCSHDWQYESDPSGNSDSGYYCRACQGWRRSLP